MDRDNLIQNTDSEAAAQAALMEMYSRKRAEMEAAKAEAAAKDGAEAKQLKQYKCSRCGRTTEYVYSNGLCVNCFDADLIAEHDKREREFAQTEEGRKELLDRALKPLKMYLPTSAELTPAFRDRNWSKCVVDNDNQRAVQVAKRYAFSFDQIRRSGSAANGLFLTGDVGCGKTFLASCLCNTLLTSGVTCVMDTENGITNSIRGKYGSGSAAGSADDLINLYKNAGLLIIDDLRKSAPTNWSAGIIFEIVNYRYDHRRPVVITSNYSLQELARVWLPKDARDKTDSLTSTATVDRFREMCAPVAMYGASRRGLTLVKGGSADGTPDQLEGGAV